MEKNEKKKKRKNWRIKYEKKQQILNFEKDKLIVIINLFEILQLFFVFI